VSRGKIKNHNLKIMRSLTITRYLYVLALEDGFFYIGKTNFLARRLREHFDINKGRGCKITNQNKPLRVIHHEVILCTDKELSLLESKLAIRFAKTYGLDVVFGGGLVSKNPNINIQNLKMEKVTKITTSEFNAIKPTMLNEYLYSDLKFIKLDMKRELETAKLNI
jgi:predicted GIY-YIG superfamily endonuclease